MHFTCARLCLPLEKILQFILKLKHSHQKQPKLSFFNYIERLDNMISFSAVYTVHFIWKVPPKSETYINHLLQDMRSGENNQCRRFPSSGKVFKFTHVVKLRWQKGTRRVPSNQYLFIAAQSIINIDTWSWPIGNVSLLV